MRTAAERRELARRAGFDRGDEGAFAGAWDGAWDTGEDDEFPATTGNDIMGMSGHPHSREEDRSMATITARYRGTCAVCGEDIDPGQQMDYEKGRDWQRHARCPAPEIPAGAIEKAEGEGYGGEPRQVGKPFRNRQPYTNVTPEHEPDYLVPLLAWSRYIKYDGMSFGVGDESGYIHCAICRPATEDEAAPLIAAAEAAQRRRLSRALLEREARRIGQEEQHVEQ